MNGLNVYPTSVVIGIYGRWGEGKTTVLNFIERRLAESDSIVCVRFNPWLYQSESQLLLSFFESLATAVGRTLKTKKEEMGKWLRSLGTALGTVSVGPGIVGVTPGSALQSVGTSLSSVDIREKRCQLEELIAESGKRIVIMIDDIDRLDDGEIATVFKLVKLAADFSYTAYVLAFDQGVVAKALAKRYADSEGSGSSFIEKIVQVPIELPRAHEGILQDITVEAMGKVLHGAAAQLTDDDANRFALVFQRYLAPHIGTPRMVKRIANAIEFVVPLLDGEVNVADLLLLQTTSVLFPSVYRQMPGVKDALLGELFDYRINNIEDVVRQQLAPLFKGLGDDADDVTGHCANCSRASSACTRTTTTVKSRFPDGAPPSASARRTISTGSSPMESRLATSPMPTCVHSGFTSRARPANRSLRSCLRSTTRQPPSE